MSTQAKPVGPAGPQGPSKPSKPARKQGGKQGGTSGSRGASGASGASGATGAPGLTPEQAAILRAAGVDISALNSLGAGSYDGLYSDGEAQVRNFDVYVGADYGFRSTKTGAVRTKIKASELLDALTNMDAAKYRALQEKLFRGGLYGTADRKNVAFGDRNDPDTRLALSRAIARNILANRTTSRSTRLTLDDVLDDAVANAPAVIGEGASGAVFSYQPPDPAALRQAIDKAMPGYIGKALSPGETQQLTDEIQQHLEAAARSRFNVSQNGGVAAPEFDPNAYIEQRAQQLHPDEFGARRMADLSAQFLQGIQSGSVDRTF